MVVISITMILTGLLLPALRGVHENALRLTCAANMRQLGEGFAQYASDHNDVVPHSWYEANEQPQNLMALNRPADDGASFELDGLGLLLQNSAFGGYVGCSSCLYCPAHTGAHSAERYEPVLAERNALARREVMSNYHYMAMRGAGRLRVRMDQSRLLLTDGLRTRADVNHRGGMNRLWGDLAVDWWADVDDSFRSALPNDLLPPAEQKALFDDVLDLLDGAEQGAMMR